MNAHTKDRFDNSAPARLWPWLLIAGLILVIATLLRLGASASQPGINPAITPDVAARQPALATANQPLTGTDSAGQATPAVASHNTPTTVSTSRELANDQLAHAGDDSVFLKDDDDSAADTGADEDIGGPDTTGEWAK